MTYKMKILITFFQIIVGLSFRPEYPYPTYFRSFISAFAFITFDFVPWQSLVLRAPCGRFAAHFVGAGACDQGCLTPIDFYIKILVRSRPAGCWGRASKLTRSDLAAGDHPDAHRHSGAAYPALPAAHVLRGPPRHPGERHSTHSRTGWPLSLTPCANSG